MENQPADDVPLSMYTNSQGVRAHFHRVRIICGAVIVSAFIATVMLILQGEGVCIENFVDGEKTDEQIKSLLDYQNSITGTISSFIAKPVDFFTGMVVAAGFLCFATGNMLDRDGGLQWFYLPMLTGGALAFLFSNGLNSLNVQVITGALTEVISTADLAYVSNLQDVQQLSVNGSLVTTWNRSYAENASGNSVFNTILRTHLLTRDSVASQCTGTGDVDELALFKALPLVMFDFQPRTWQLETLTTALKPLSSLKIPMSTASTGAGAALPSPVNVSSNLVIIALMTLKDLNLNDLSQSSEYPLAKYAQTSTNSSTLTRVADVYNLSTASSSAGLEDDDDAAEQFLKTSHALFKKAFALTVNASVNDASVEYNRFNISANITFDSLTIELPVTKLQTNKKHEVVGKSSDGYNSVDIGDYCSRDGCVIPSPVFESDGDRMSIQPRVQVARMCLNDDDSEDLTVFNAADGKVSSQCNRTSNSSLLVVSIGKRVEGDEWDASAAGKEQFSNLRTVYSLTVGRLSWTTEDLADAFAVECAPDADCEGLRFQVTPDSNTSDHLLCGASSLAILQLTGHFDFSNPSRVKWKYLVLAGDRAESDGFDLLLPRRFASASTSGSALRTIASDHCSSFADDYVTMVEKNHLYMEQSLQTGYTTAFYYLFQNGVLQQTVNSSDSSTMNFAGNVQAMNVQVSIPLANAIVSLVGCFLLIAGSVGLVIRAKQSERMLEERADADVVMEAMVDNNKYPPLLLDMGLRQDASSSVEPSTHIPVQDLRVGRAVLHHRKTSKHVFHVTSESQRPE
ncbi:hypothetical protein Gpo141_00002478 [Globisporangium polare]